MLHFTDVTELIAYQASLGSQPAVCEIAGGTARTSRILLGYRKRIGRNFDLVCGIDLLNKKDRDAFMQYRARSRVRVVVMSPACSRFGGWSHLDRQIYQDTWRARRIDDDIIAAFCGGVAIAQYADKLDWLLEQPVGSDMMSVEPWPKIMKDDRTRQVIFDQCQCGAKAREGHHIKKPTRATASCDDLLYYLQGLQCGSTKMCTGQHLTLTGKRADDARIWPWMLARRVAWGIMRRSAGRRAESATAGGDAFATTLPCVPGANRIAEDDADIDDASSYVLGANQASMTTPSGFYPARAGGADDRTVSSCPGCARHRPQDHEQHSRVQGVCRYLTSRH